MAKTIKKELFNPLVSIVIPVYNGSNYVREAIDSALAQTYKNIEVIVVNDGSTDNTEEIVKSYGKKLRYFKKENGGVATALNLGIKKSKGEFISWLSHDDTYYLDKIEKQIEVLSKLDKEFIHKTILYSNYSLINENSEKISDLYFEKTHFIEKLNYPLYPLLNGLINGCTLLIPKKCFIETGLFDTKLKATQDYDLWFKMFPENNLIFQKNLFVKTRIHPEQSTKKILTVNQECDILWIKMIKGLTDQQKIKISGSLLLFYTKTYNLVKNAGYTDAKKYLFKLINDDKKRNISKIKVSVIIPFFNRVAWTVEAINSVIKQTHKNLQIIIVDDASTDNIKKIIDLCERDKRINYYRNEINSGVSKSRNFGIDKSDGDFIAFLDSDDLFMPKKIEMQLYFMVSSGYVFSHTSYEVFSSLSDSCIKVDSGKVDYLYPSIIAGCSIATPTVMIKKDFFVDLNNRFPEEINLGEDVCLWIQLSKQCNLYGLNISLSKVRKHGNNASESDIKQMIGIKNQFDYVFKNSLDIRSYSELKKLNELLFFYINNIFNEKSLDINKNIHGSNNFLKRKIKDLILILFYKIDKIFPRKIRRKIKPKLTKYSIVRKYLIKY